MKLLPLFDDFVFKAIFGKNPDLLLDLLNSFPEFSGEKEIREIRVLNPEIPKDGKLEKLSILDMNAQDILGNKFLIEIQASRQISFPKRALYYWSKLYTKSLRKGQNFKLLPKVYSFNFLNYIQLPNTSEFHSVFHLLEKNNSNLRLTEDLEIHIVELPKLLAHSNFNTKLENWVYLLRVAQNLKGEEMKTLEKSNPKIKKAVSELRTISKSEAKRYLYESRLKSELVYNTGMVDAFDRGLEKGIEQGLEKGIEQGLEKGIEQGLEKAIEIALELKFGSDGLKLLPKIRNKKTSQKPSEILTSIKKEKTLSDFKKALKLKV